MSGKSRSAENPSARASFSGKQGRKTPKGPGRKKEPGVYQRLASLYQRMEQAYTACAEKAGLSCEGCPTNCCTSFFQHHTYVEWSYLWRGLYELAPDRRQEIVSRAGEYVDQARQALSLGLLPNAMCPLNENGLCILYPYRLMICRMHGTRNVFTRPDGGRHVSPGCERFTALPCSVNSRPSVPDAAGQDAAGQDAAGQDAAGSDIVGPEREDPEAVSEPCPTLDRTPFYNELAALELEFHRKAGQRLPRVNLTLAEMIVLGPPKVR